MSKIRNLIIKKNTLNKRIWFSAPIDCFILTNFYKTNVQIKRWLRF